MGGKISISLIVGVVVAAVIWGVIYEQTNGKYAALNWTLGDYDYRRSQQSLQDNAPIYALLGGVIAGGILLALMSSGRSSSSPNLIAKSATTASDEMKCPFCAEMIKREAKICRYCGRDISNANALATGTKTETRQETRQAEKSGDAETPTPQWLIELASSPQPASSHNADARLDETIAKRPLLWRMTRAQWAVIAVLATGVVIVFFSILYIFVIARVSLQTTLPSQVNAPAPESGTATLIPTFGTPTPAVPPCTSTTQRISIPSSQNNWGEMPTGCSKSFVVGMRAGQGLSLAYFGYGTQASMMTVRDPSGKIIEGEGAAGTHYYTATSTGDYTITFQGTGTLMFDIGLSASSSTQSTILPTPVTKRISFARGGISATVQGTTGAVDADHWAVAVLGGQTMSINLIVPNGKSGTLVVFGADGTVLLSNRTGMMQWSGLLPKTQDYFIDVRPETGAMSYTLQVTIPPLK